MSNVGSPTRPAVPPALEERLKRGADLLFDMEQRGDTGDHYRRWLDAWKELLTRYEASYQPR